MQVKIDTSERFHVITIQESTVSANMTVFLKNTLYAFLDKAVSNLLLNWNEVNSIDREAADCLMEIQKRFEESRASFISCHLRTEVKDQLKAWKLLSELNQVPTESEAIDMILMEEIERELDDEQ